LVASLKKQWNNGGRPTLVTIGVGSLLTIMVTVAVFLHTTATARFSEQLSQVQSSIKETKGLIEKLDNKTSQQIKDSEDSTTAQLNRTEARLSEQICRVKEDTTRRVERLEDQFNQAKGPRWVQPIK